MKAGSNAQSMWMRNEFLEIFRELGDEFDPNPWFQTIDAFTLHSNDTWHHWFAKEIFAALEELELDLKWNAAMVRAADNIRIATIPNFFGCCGIIPAGIDA